MIKEVTERINNHEIKFDVLGDILDTEVRSMVLVK